MLDNWLNISKSLELWCLNYDSNGGCRKFEEFISKYNSLAANRNFRILTKLTKSLNYNGIFPYMIENVLKTKEILINPIPYLKKQQNKKVTITESEAFIILLNAFFSTFPFRDKVYNQRNLYLNSKIFSNFPYINFLNLFHSNRHSRHDKVKEEKLKCIFEYFNHMIAKNLPSEKSKKPERKIIFERRVLGKSDMVNWSLSEKPTIEVEFTSKKYEDFAHGLKVDFANKFAGGGVLGNGASMEEILFSSHPELIVSRLFTEKLDDNEVLLISGAKRFVDYSGYSDNFKFIERFNEPDSFENEFVIMDAIQYNGWCYLDQYKDFNINRELNKCFCGFREMEITKRKKIITGNWGCGYFHGDPEIKFLIQLIAASEAERPKLIFCTQDSELIIKIQKVYDEYKRIGNVRGLYSKVLGEAKMKYNQYKYS